MTFRFSALLATAVVLVAAQAQAIHVDFKDYRHADNGTNSLDINVNGVSITIAAEPSHFDLNITSSGLGIECTSRGWRCLTNSSSQIDAEWGESISITFNDGPVALQRAGLRKLFRGETAVVAVNDGERKIWGSRNGRRNVNLGGVIAEKIVFSAKGLFSDFAIRSLRFDLVDPTTGGPGPVPQPVPEPTAALLFAVGLAAAGTKLRR